VRRVLVPGGSLHLLDFESSEGGAHGVLARWLHTNHRLKDNSVILEMMKTAGFANAKKAGSGALFLGHLKLVITVDLATTRRLILNEGSRRRWV